MKTGVEGLEISTEQKITQTEKSSSNGKEWVTDVMEFIAWAFLIANVIAAFVYGVSKEGVYVKETVFNGIAFFGLLFSGCFGFIFLQSLTIIVKAANKYLNHKLPETD